VAGTVPMVRPLLLGVTFAALVYGFVPEGWLAGVLGTTTWWTLPLAAVLGLPLYLRGEAAFPIGAGLLAAGRAAAAVVRSRPHPRPTMRSVGGTDCPSADALPRILRARRVPSSVARGAGHPCRCRRGRGSTHRTRRICRA
jgi:hypothetical protein